MTRSKVPKWIKKGEGKVSIGKGCNQPMTFKKQQGRSPRSDQGKKYNTKHNTPNIKNY